MNLQVEEGIPNWLLSFVVVSCASPAVTLNVWPRVEQMITSGGPTSNQIGIVLLVTLSALGMTAVPFAMKKAENWGFWLTCLAFGIGLAILNYTMAVGAVGKSRDEEAGLKESLIRKAAQFQESLGTSQRLRASLPPFKWTTQEMVDSAKLAVTLTDDARTRECQKIGDYCRALVAQLGNRQAELAEISAAHATTARARQLDDSIRDLQHSLANLGPIPENSDQQASRIATLLGGFFILGPNAAERVATGLIHFLAICAEAFALGMPRIIVTALARKPDELRATKTTTVPPRTIPLTVPPIPNPLPNRAAVPKPKSTSSKPSDQPKASVVDWKLQFLIRSTGKTRDWEFYEHYKIWAKSTGLAPSDFRSFNSELQKLGLRLESDPISKRDFFLETAIKAPLKAVS